MSNQVINSTIANRLANAQTNIKIACQSCQRAHDSVQLMAVSKTKPSALIVQAYEQGQRIFGENYAQELVEKQQALQHLTDIEWHFIGPIQSNKTRVIATHADWVDSLDREKIALRLNEVAIEQNKIINVLIQVNISNSMQKSGVLLEQVHEFAEFIHPLTHLQLRGLMSIPDKTDDEEKLKSEFAQLHACFSQLQHQYPCASETKHNQIDTLSIGMSNDMDTAIQCGSTMVRLGTAIFGSRN